MTEKLSAASIRAKNYTRDDEWYCEIVTKDITGDLAEDRPGMVRRDPTAVIEVNGVFHSCRHVSLIRIPAYPGKRFARYLAKGDIGRHEYGPLDRIPVY